MKTKAPKASQMRAEYQFDYGTAVRGKYLKGLVESGSVVVVLEPDVARAFPTAEAVNEALRVVLKAGQAARKPARATAPKAKR